MKRPSNQPTKLVPHPNFPEVVATVRKPTRREQFARVETMRRFRVNLVMLNADKTPVINPATGEPYSTVQQEYPREAVLEGLRMTVLKVEGITDGNDHPIVIPGPNGENLDELFEEYLDVKREGKPTVTYAMYLVEQINAEGAFDPDPTAGRSPTP